MVFEGLFVFDDSLMQTGLIVMSLNGRFHRETHLQYVGLNETSQHFGYFKAAVEVKTVQFSAHMKLTFHIHGIYGVIFFP